MARRHAGWIIVLGCLLAGCAGQREASTNAAIQHAIEQHLANRPGIEGNKLILEVQKVTVQGDQAEAEVVFRSRDDPRAQMAYHYELRREGGEWKVGNGRPGAAGSPHPNPGSEPEGGEGLPPGHPSVEGSPPVEGSPH